MKFWSLEQLNTCWMKMLLEKKTFIINKVAKKKLELFWEKTQKYPISVVSITS
jgi:hypothetical protein